MAHIPSNAEIARIFSAIADYLAMEDVPFKPRAYEKVAETIASYDRPLIDLYKEGGLRALETVPGVGKNIAEKIEELLKTGKLDYYEKLKKKTPVDVAGLTAIEGVGPKMIKALWQKRKIRTIEDLERAALAGKLRTLPRFGKKSEEKILKSIGFLKTSKGRFLLGAAIPLVRRMEERLREIKGAGQVVTAGSYRRMQETVGDVDILVTAKEPERIIEAFLRFPEVEHVYGRGPTKVNVRLRAGIDADIRVLKPDEYGSALQYFTGDKAHNIETRKIAIKKGYKLSEYGLFKGKKRIAGRTEEEVYKKLGLAWIPPEIRTASGEIEAARNNELPKLLPFDAIQGDLQVQTSWTDGKVSIAEMAAAAEKFGLSYIAITDHTKALAMTGGLNEKDLAEQGKEIDALNSKSSAKGGSASGGEIRNPKFRILKSSEVDILKDGSLDLADEALRKLDLVSVSVHSYFGMPEKEMTERIIRAIKHPLVNIVFHPTGRLIGRREPYAVDILKVLRAAKEYGVAMEVNGSMDRLDLRDAHVRDAVKMGVKLVVDSDAHAPHHFSWLELGIAQARRGWAEKKDVLNTLPCDEFLKKLKGLKRK